MDNPNPIVELPRVKDVNEFDRVNTNKVDTGAVFDAEKRYAMFIQKKKNLMLPLTFQEQKITNILS